MYQYLCTYICINDGKRSEVLQHEREGVLLMAGGLLLFEEVSFFASFFLSWFIGPCTRLADDGKRSEDSQSSGVERFVERRQPHLSFVFFFWCAVAPYISVGG